VLFANSILPIITKPTRITDQTATLIDHIYTNSVQNLTAGILTIDITDHPPILCIVKTQPPRNNNDNNNRRYYKDYSELDNQCFIDDVKSIIWHSILDPDKSLNDKTHEAISTLNVIVDKPAPIRLASRAKQKLLNNLKRTWKIIGSLIKRKAKGQISPSRIIHNNITFTKEKDIAELFNHDFVNIGPTLAKEIKTDHRDPTQYNI